MRLLKIGDRGELSLADYFIGTPPEYAILSHRWDSDDNEVNFEDIRQGMNKSKAGYSKIRFCQEQARKDSLQHFWIDTCCIDKANHTELSEAINSMFQWYKNAAKCYVFLSDVSASKRDEQGFVKPWELTFRKSTWFTRGWTLQELLAPSKVEFYSREGQSLGDKISLKHVIHEITTISLSALQNTDLSQHSVSERMRWAEHRSTTRPEDKAYCLSGIFGVHISPMYGEGEHAFVRLKNKIAKKLRQEMDDSTQSQASVASASPSDDLCNDRTQRLSRLLDFDQRESRRSTIRNAFAATCRWLLSHPVYLEWLDPVLFERHCGFLWIKGKPGAGKSTLMKLAHAHSFERRGERRSCHEVCLSFFFNARGDALEKSTLGMYRALLCQLFEQAPDLQSLLHKYHFILETVDPSACWTINLLCELLETAMLALNKRHIICFIDALDECDDEQIRDMIIFFEELGQKVIQNGSRLRICLASRHYPAIDFQYGQQMILETEQNHAQDIEKYVRRHIRIGKGNRVDKIMTAIQAKANGVFMWVVLVLNVLNEEYSHGRIFAVEKRLKEMPEKLGEIFKDILKRDHAHMASLKFCIQLVLFAQQPLKREEFYFAMMTHLESQPVWTAVWNPNVITSDDMDGLVLGSSKGLAEVTRAERPTVQFIHESVRDFLFNDSGLFEIWPELKHNFHVLSHDALKQCCQVYLNAHAPRVVSTVRIWQDLRLLESHEYGAIFGSEYPFLEYATRFVLYHANEASESLPQDEFLDFFDVESWIVTNNIFEEYQFRNHHITTTLSYILAEHGYTNLINTLGGHDLLESCPKQLYRYSLFAALAQGHLSAARALLRLARDVPIDAVLDPPYEGARAGRHHHSYYRRSPEIGYIAEIFLQNVYVELNRRDHEAWDLFSLAARQGYVKVCERFRDGNRNLLQIGESFIRELLLEQGFELNKDTRSVSLLEDGSRSRPKNR